MKKLLSVVLSLSLVAILFLSTANVSAGEITVEIDGKPIEFDVNPQIIEGRTMVPLRKIFEGIGALVKWDNDTQTVQARKSSKTITLSVGSADLQIDKGKTDAEGNPITETAKLEVPAQIAGGRTLVPARAISESFGLNVDWDEKNRKVVITSDDEKDDSWKENKGNVNLAELTFEGEGVDISDNQIKITKGGDYTLTGTLDDGNITISTKEKVKLRLSGAKIISGNNPCIFAEDADKVYITLTDGTENMLVAKNSEDGAIYSKENLEISGGGALDIESEAGHGIKASDNLTVENGIITINAFSDGIHINDTFKMKGGTLNISSVGDGIDSESIVNISGGIINIETNGTPVEAAQSTTETATTKQRWPMWDMDEADVEFEKSTKGISAEWMMVISGGEINVNSASHTVHCADEMEISGGKFTLSSEYDKGISAHGNLTINGSETIIDVIKSTEGIESKNVLTINDGVINVVSIDDALNATGGNSGMMMPGGNFGGGFGGNGGENRVPPQGDDANKSMQNTDGTQPNTRPGRGENGQFGGMRPGGEIPANGEFTPPEISGEAGNFTPPFEMPENGEFTPPFGNNENGEFIPPAGNRPQMNEDGAFPGGMGGMGRNMKDCLIINGGYLELCGNDDCIDANGNLLINGGTVMATNQTGSFTGNFGVLDADGQITIGENANIILAGGSGRGFSLPQNSVTVYCESNHSAGEKITVSDLGGNVLYEYAPKGGFRAVLIASNSIKTGETYKITAGNEAFETEIIEQSTVVGTQQNGGMGFGRGQRMQ